MKIDLDNMLQSSWHCSGLQEKNILHIEVLNFAIDII